MLVSSAYILTSPNLSERGRSLIYIRNSKGPRQEPWGTPYLIDSMLETCPLTLQHCLRFCKVLARQARGHIGDDFVKWKHFLNDVADQTGTVRGRIERAEMSLKPGFHMVIAVIVSICRRLIGDTSPMCRSRSPTVTIIWKPGLTHLISKFFTDLSPLLCSLDTSKETAS